MEDLGEEFRWVCAGTGRKKPPMDRSGAMETICRNTWIRR